MNRSKRLSAALAAAMLAGVTLAAGCQPGSPGSGTTSGAAPSQSEGTDASSSESREEAKTIIWYNGGEDQPSAGPVYQALNAALLDKYNIQLDFRTVPFGLYDERMNMVISSQENYDLAFTSQAWINKYPIQVGRGAFLALDEYLDNFTALKEALPEFLFEQARIDGKIYAIPNYQITYSQWGYLFRKDLIDASGFDYTKIKNYWDAEPFWAYVKENHPDLYPTNATMVPNFADPRNQFIPVDANAFYDRDDETYKLSMYLDKEESLANKFGPYYQGLQNRMLWEKGYLREDIATVQDQTADDAAGKFASISGVIKPGGEAERKKKSANYDWVQVGVQDPFTTSVAARSSMTAVNALSEHPEEALRMLEIMNTDAEMFNLLNFGLEGTNYNLNDEGKVSLIDESGYFYNSAWAIGNQFNALLMDNQEDGIWEETDRLNREAEITPINGFSYSNENVITETANVAAVTQEFLNWEYQDDYEARYDQYVAKLKAAGAETILAELQRQLDEWVAANK